MDLIILAIVAIGFILFTVKMETFSRRIDELEDELYYLSSDFAIDMLQGRLKQRSKEDN